MKLMKSKLFWIAATVGLSFAPAVLAGSLQERIPAGNTGKVINVGGMDHVTRSTGVDSIATTAQPAVFCAKNRLKYPTAQQPTQQKGGAGPAKSGTADGRSLGSAPVPGA